MRCLRGDHALAQLVRFALVGGSSNIAYVAAFTSMNESGPLVANIVGSILSTVIANELHRRLTFRATGRVGWFNAQWEGGALALIGLLISTAAVAGLEFSVPGLGEIAQAGAVIAIMAAVGGLRFWALRGFVFRRLDNPDSARAAPIRSRPPEFDTSGPSAVLRRSRQPANRSGNSKRKPRSCAARSPISRVTSTGNDPSIGVCV